jgi:cell division protein FtsB
MASRKRKRPPRSRLLLRWGAVGVFVLIGVLYFKPARTYLHTRNTVAARQAEVTALKQQHERLQRLVAASASDAELAREARRLGLVRPGEHLFIVKGIKRWLKKHPDTLGSDG